ncbi:hypothetical protein RQP46_000316 [Phenoliferia psychrophenolica]
MFASLRTLSKSLVQPHSTRALSTSLPVRFAAPSAPRLADATAHEDAPPPLTDGEKVLKDKLESALSGANVQVQDVSGGCGTFYAISISHESFKGLSVIKQHRAVNELLKEEIKDMHGLQLKTSA